MRKIACIALITISLSACGGIDYHPVTLADNTAQCRIRAVNNVENPNTFGNINSSPFICRAK